MSETQQKLPAPGDLEKYERLVPGSAARILALAEEQANEEAWVRTTLAREERLTRLMSFTALCLSASSAVLGFGAFVLGKSLAN